jgi:hypothetical protein
VKPEVSAVRAVLDEAAVREALARRLAAPGADPGGVVWVRDGDEVVVWLDSLRVRLEPGLIRVGVDLEADQTERAGQEVAFAVAEPADPPSLLAVAEETARGDARLAARWGQTLQEAVWSALVAIAGDASGMAAAAGELVLNGRGPA